MRLDHTAYRVADKEEARKFFMECLGYTLQDTFDIEFDDGTSCECYAMTREGESEIFVSQGEPGSIVANWVEKHGNGIHHLAYEVANVNNAMAHWEAFGIKFMSDPITCDDGSLIQVFSQPDPITGIVYELIQKVGGKGFCKESVKSLMESTDD